MLCIHQAAAISAQESFGNIQLDQLRLSSENKLNALEPAYTGIPPGPLRRMGKAVRMGVGVGLSLLRARPPVQGIILGTADGGLEDCIKFLNQIVEYKEGLLAPANFVQSTANAIAAQIGLMTGNRCYNITHVHRGLAFENAMIDAAMRAAEYPAGDHLLAGVDEISLYNYNIDRLAGWHKEEVISNQDLYHTDTPGSIAGEGAAAFLVNGNPAGALARVEAIRLLHTREAATVRKTVKEFLDDHSSPENPVDLLISGENGDNRVAACYAACESSLPEGTAVARFKHMTGEFPTASAIALWLACRILSTQQIPSHMMKTGGASRTFRRILVYNNFKSVQHGLFLVSGNP